MIHHAVVADDVSLAYARDGAGGTPLLLIHGYPETKRIWWRNIAPLAAAGFDVIVPDLRGAGDSDIPPDDRHDLVTYSRDLYTLVHDRLGHSSCVIAASDVGAVVATDMIHRFPGFVDAFCVFNTVPPLGVDYTGIESLSELADTGASDPTGDYRWMQGAFPDELAAMLPTPAARRQWVAAMYTNRLWGSRYAFDQTQIDFMTEPFADEARLRSGWATYQLAYGRAMSEIPLMDAVDVVTLVLYGPDDHAVGEDFVPKCERAFRNRIGPLVVPGAGHFLQ
jgi:pimeloyl-ACP methyl ester carboxylesterase